MEHLVAGALDEWGALEGNNAALHRDGLFTSAQLVIESYSRDPGFDAVKLAKELSVSARSVHAAFSAFGTTPRREIERRRLSEVDRRSGQLLTLTQNVELSGFTSLRQYRRVAARHETPGLS